MAPGDAHSEKVPIVYILDNFWRGGGTENQLATLIDHLDRTRFTPYVFNLRPKANPIEINCDVIYMNVTRLISFKAIKEMLEMARFLRDKDARLLQVYFVDSRVIGVTAGWFAGMKKIIACRRESGWFKSRYKKFLLRTFGRLAKYRLVNAAAIKEVVSRGEKFPIDKIEVIHNGIDFKPRPGAVECTKSDFGIPESSSVVGMVGNLRPVKRYDRFLEAASRVNNKDVHFLIVGTGPLRDDLEKKAAELGLEDRVHIHHADKGTYYILRLFDIGVSTSESEGLSNVLIEYAMAGLSTLAFDVGGNSEVVSDGETGYILPDGDVAGLSDKLNQLLDDHELAAKFGRRAAELAREKFSVEKMVKATEDFYERILAEP